MPDNIYEQVKAVFDKYGVPEIVWVPIALAESGMNPNAVGDKGASIGLFQINTKGGQGVGLNPDQLRNPVYNSEIAARAIAPAYNAIRSQYPAAKWAGETARRSGHPGGSISKPFDANDKRIKSIDTLAQKYAAGYLQANQLYIAGSNQPPGVLGNTAPGSAPTDASLGLGGLNDLAVRVMGLMDSLKNFDPLGAGIVAGGVILALIGVVMLAAENETVQTAAKTAVKAAAL